MYKVFNSFYSALYFSGTRALRIILVDFYFIGWLLIRSMMGSKYPSRQFSSGLHIGGMPEQPKERTPRMSSTVMPYTGGDLKKSGELGKMFKIPTDGSKSMKSGSIAGGMPGSALLKKSSSEPLNKHGEPMKMLSGPQSGRATRQNSGTIPLVLPTNGLISGPMSSGPLNSSEAPRKALVPLESFGLRKIKSISISHNPAVTTFSRCDDYSCMENFPKMLLWLTTLIFLVGFPAGVIILVAVHNAILLVAVGGVFGAVAALFLWNMCWGRRSITKFIACYPDTDLRTAQNDQYVKVSGVVTCGNVPLESSFQGVPRCVYTSTRLFEYRGWGSKPANPSHCPFTWGLRSLERHAVDFYISDSQSGLRALVKTGRGAKVTTFVDDSFAIDIDPKKKDLSPDFTRWLAKKNLSGDDCVMRLREGEIKEGSTVSVMGIVKRNESLLMIVPPPEPFETGCLWWKCISSSRLDGIVLRCADESDVDVIPV